MGQKDVRQSPARSVPARQIDFAPNRTTAVATDTSLEAPFEGNLQAPDPSAVNQGSLLDQASQAVVVDDIPEEPRKGYSRQRLMAFGLLSFGLVAALLLGLKVEAAKSKAQNLSSLSSRIQQQQVPLTTINKQLGTAAPVNNAVTVNGQLQVTNSLVLQPSTASSPAVTGQMYYDANTNSLAYYNGSKYVTLQGGGNTYVTNVAGSTTNVTNVTNVTNITNVSGGGFTGTGTPGTLALFASSTTLGGSLITESGTTLNVGAATGVDTTNVQGGTGGVSISTQTVDGSSGAVTIASGGSNTGGAGNVSVDTGPGVVTGTPVGTKTFEGGTDNLAATYGYQDTLTQSTAQAHGGTHSLAVSVGPDPVNTPDSWSVIDLTPYYAYPVTPGHKYAFSAWVRAGTNASTITFDADFSSTGYIGGGEVAQDIIGTITDASGSWKQVTGIIKAPDGANEVLWEVHGTSTAFGEVHYLDDMAITDMNGSTGSSELNLGANNAQSVTLGNDFEVGQTLLKGGSGITLDSGTSATAVNAGEFDVNSTLGVNIDSGAGNTNITTAASGVSSGAITIESGNSSATASGDVTVDTGSGFVSGTVTSAFDFEDNTTENIDPWFGDTLAPTNTAAHGGTYSLAMTTTGSFWGIILNGNNYVMPVVAGHHVVFSAWIRAATTPRSIAGHVNFMGSSSVPISTITDSTSGWTEATLSTVVPAGATSAIFSFSSSGAAVGETHYFDDITMTDLSSSASSSTLHLGDTNAQAVSIGNVNELEATTIEGGSGIAMNSGSGPFSLNAGSVTITGTAASTIGTSFGQLMLTSGGGTGGGVVVVPQSNSTDAFQVQNSGGDNLFNVDTADSEIVLGTDGAVPTATAIRGGDAVGNNLLGANLNISASDGTGVGGSGNINFYTGGGVPNPLPTVDSTSGTEEGSVSNNAPLSWTHTIGAEGNMVLIVAVDTIQPNSSTAPATAATVTYNGVAMTELTSLAGSGTEAYGSVWYLANPPSGAHTVAVTFTGPASSIGVESTSFYNVDTSNPIAGFQAQAAYASTTSTTLTGTNPGEGVFDAVMARADWGTVPIAGPGQTELYAQGFFGDKSVGSFRQGIAGATTMSWTDSASAELNQVVIALTPEPNVTPDPLSQTLSITQSGTLGVDLGSTETAQAALSFGGSADRVIAVDQNPGTGAGHNLTIQAGGGAAGNNNGGNLVLQGGIATGSGTGGSVIVEPQTDSLTAFEIIQNSSGSALLTANTTNLVITIAGTPSSFATLAISNGHVSSTQTTAPTASAPANCGVSSSSAVTAGSTDTAGSFTVTAGTGAPTTCDTTVTFSMPYGATPKSIIVTPTDAIGASPQGLSAIVTSATTTGFTIQIKPANPAASSTNAFYYWIVQ